MRRPRQNTCQSSGVDLAVVKGGFTQGQLVVVGHPSSALGLQPDGHSSARPVGLKLHPCRVNCRMASSRSLASPQVRKGVAPMTVSRPHDQNCL
jgi:hypothetical protein